MFNIKNLNFKREENQIFKSLNLKIEQGEKLILGGHNGIGKTTLLKLMAGIYYADSGEVLYKDTPLCKEAFKNKEFRKNFRTDVALLFQNIDAMLFNPSVYDEIAFTPRQLGLNNIDELVKNAAKLCGIENLLDSVPFKLSGGQKQRVALASVLVHSPNVLLLDEPTSNLDLASMKMVCEILNSLNDVTIVVVSHDHDFTDCLEAREVSFEGLLS